MLHPLLLLLPLGGGDPVAAAPAPAPRPDDSLAGRSTFWWGDFDGDGLVDAWVVRAHGVGRLLKNAGDGRLDDVTERAGLGAVAEAHMALWADYDRDGRLDLFLPSWNEASRLYRQSAPGTFAEVTRDAGVGALARVVDAEWLDYDGDGALDLHVTALDEEALLHNDGRGGFERIALELPSAVPFFDRFALPATPDEARAQRGLAPVLPGADTSSALGGAGTPIGGGASTPGIAVCASGVEDWSSPGVCMPANSIPTLGHLYPISSELFVEAGTGRVGIGTTSPGAQLDVTGDVRTSNRFVSTLASGSPFVVNSTTLVQNLNADRLDGFDASAFSQLGTTIETVEIANDAVTRPKLATGAVSSDEVLNESLTADDLAPNSVGKAEIQPQAVGTTELVDEGVTAADLATDSVGALEIAAAAVTGVELAGGSVTNGHVATNAAIAGTKIVPDFGNQPVVSRGASAFGGNGVNTLFSVKGENGAGPTFGYLGVLGANDHDGVPSADWNSREIGVAGIATDTSFTDNYAVLGHSNGVGVRGEYAGAPTSNFAELGLNGIGLRATGTDYAADLNGAVVIDAATSTYPGFQTTQTGPSRAGSFVQQNDVAIAAALFASSTSVNSDHHTLIASHLGAGPAGAAFFETTDAANSGINTWIRNNGTGRSLYVEAEQPNTVATQISRNASNHLLNNDMLQIDVLSGSGANSQFIECERGADVEFRVDGDGDVFADGAFTGPADFAEMIEVSTGADSVSAGDVLVIDPSATRSVEKSWDAYSTLVAGVYSTNPGFVGSERSFVEDSPVAGEEPRSLKREDMAVLYGEVPVAVVGIVPCKVSLENGPIRPGDLLVTSSTPGHAMSDANPPVGTVVGKALEAFDGAAGAVGTIKILVTLQ